jgi:HlyD family secretion protein
VYSLPVHPGQFVSAGDLLVQVADLSSVELLGYVDEPDIGHLRVGEPVEVRWDALPGRTWDGTVSRVPFTVVPIGSRNVGEITCRVKNEDLKLLPNINVSVNIITAQAQNTIVVPREAVHAEDGQRFVFAIVNGKLRRQDVQTAISNLTDIEISQGLAEKTQVALGAMNTQALREGLPVKTVGQ